MFCSSFLEKFVSWFWAWTERAEVGGSFDSAVTLCSPSSVASWFISPLLSGIMSGLLFLLIRYFILSKVSLLLVYIHRCLYVVAVCFVFCTALCDSFVCERCLMIFTYLLAYLHSVMLISDTLVYLVDAFCPGAIRVRTVPMQELHQLCAAVRDVTGALVQAELRAEASAGICPPGFPAVVWESHESHSLSASCGSARRPCTRCPGEVCFGSVEVAAQELTSTSCWSTAVSA